MAFRLKYYYKETVFALIFTLIIFKVSLTSYDTTKNTENGSSKVSKSEQKSILNPSIHMLSGEDVGRGNEKFKEEDSEHFSKSNLLELALLNGEETFPLSPIENDLLYRAPIDLALIFTNAANSFVHQYNLRRAVTSLLKNAFAPIRLHLISDEDSFPIGSTIIKEIQEENKWDTRHVQLVYVSSEELASEVKPIVAMLQTYFTHKSISHYRNVLFFFSLFLDRLLPGLTNIIVMDIDIKVNGDIADLHSHFSRFSDTQVMGMSPELSPVYRNILTTYRSKHPDTTLGSPYSSGGFPGYNSGVLLINIPRMKKSPVINSYLSPATLKQKVDEYDFHGHLADQDLYTLIALDHPEIFYTLPCGWNRQLCQWWNNDPFKEVFPQYFKCDDDIKLLHGNCKAKIPDEDNT